MFRPRTSIGRALRFTLFVTSAILFISAGVLAIYGLPAPPAITAEDAPRISWTWVWKSVGLVRRVQAARRFAAWMPGAGGMLVHVGTPGAVHVVERAGSKPQRLNGLPDRARFIVQSRATERPYFVFSVDEGGSERYTHYRFDLERGSYERLTPAPARSYVGPFDGEGRRVMYASTRRNQEDFDLYIVDVMNPASDTRVLESDGEFFPAAMSPDGGRALVARSTSHTTSEVFLLDIASHKLHKLFDDARPIGLWDAEWSRDGGTIYVASELDREFVGVHALDPVSGKATPLTSGLEWDVDELELLADRRTLALLVNEEARPLLYLLDVASGQLRRPSSPPPGFISKIVAHPAERRLAMDVVSPSGVIGVWTYDIDADGYLPWAVSEVDVTPLPEPVVVRYATFDNGPDAKARMTPAVVFPAAQEFTGARPVMIDIHGGPAMQATVAPAPHYELIRRLGATVIAPNVRGSRGYGRSYAALDDGLRREDAVRDIGMLLDWIAAQPHLDPTRIVVSGGSYGGYMTLASLVHYSSRVRCGFDLFGISDFVTFLEASQKEHYPESQRAEFGDERDPKTRAFLESISPARQAERIRVPLLIFQGANDVRVKPQESRQMTERIRKAGGRVTYVEAANEGHGLEQPLNQLYVGAVALEFMERCLTR